MLAKITTSAKLLFLVTVLGFFICGIGLYGVFNLRLMSKNTRSLYEDRTIPLQELTTIRYIYSIEILAAVKLVKNRNTDFPIISDKIKKAELNISKNWAAYKQTFLTSEEAALSQQTEFQMQKVNTSVEHLKDALNRKDATALSEVITNELENNINLLVYKLNNLIQIQIKISAELYAKNQLVYQRTQKQFTLAIIISLVFAVFLSFLIIGDTRKLIERLKESNWIITKSEEKCRAFIEYAGDAIFILDKDLNITDVNQAASYISGYSRNELLNMKMTDVIASEEEHSFNNKLQLIKEKKGSVHERILLKKDGPRILTEANVRQLKDIGYISILRDITERKQLTEKQNLLASIIQNSNDAVVSKTLNGIITSWNPGAERIFGYSQEEMIGKSIEVLFPPDYIHEEKEILEKIKNGNSIEHYETVRIKKDGSSIDVSITISPILDASGSVIGASKIARDITEQKKAERIIKKSEEQYRYLFDNSPAFICIWDLETLEIIEVNYSMIEKYGYSKEEWKGMSVLDYRPAADHDRIRKFAKDMLNSSESSARTTWTHYKKSGESMKMEITSHKTIYQNRKAILSLARDVTEQEAVENKLKESEEKFRTLVEQASDPIFIIAKDKKHLISVNDAACATLGYSREELLSINIDELFFEEDMEQNPLNWDMIRENKSYISERKFKRKDGSLIYAELNTGQLKDTGYISIARDITERRKTEQTLQAILDYSPENIVLMDINYKIMAFNETIKKTLFQYFGKNIKIGDDYRDFVIPSNKEIFLSFFNRAINGELLNIELETTNENNSLFFDYQMAPVYNKKGELIGTSLSAKDITHRKVVEKELTESEEKFRILVEQNLVGVFIMQNLEFLYVNPYFEQITGYSTKELTQGIKIEKLLKKEDTEKIKENYQKRINGENLTERFVVGLFRRDGSLRHLEIIISSIVYKGIPALIGTTIDITDRLEEEKRISKAVIDAQENERVQIGMELHDNVKQMLATTVLYLELIQSGIDDRKKSFEILNIVIPIVRESIEELRKLSHRLAPSVDTELSLSDKLLELINTINIEQKLQVSLAVIEPEQPLKKDIQLAIYRITQEQFNNIFKYAQATLVEVIIECEMPVLTLSIKDNGIGFDPSKKRNGIGLENIRRRAHSFGGTFRVDTSPGNGCSIIITLPVA